MSRRIRVAVLVAATTLAGGLLGPAPLVVAEGDQHSGLLTEIEAMEQARRTGQPVVASALTDEHTLVTADPETGQLSAELTATIARVRDDHGWREPSTTLIPTGQGTWTAEASALPLTISGGGDGPVVAVGAGAGSAQFTWPASLPTPTIEGDLAIFGEVTPGTDLVVRAALDGAETFLVVKNAEAAQNPLVRSMPIQIEAPQLTATVEQNGAVSYADGQGQTRLVVPPAYVWDSAGQAPQAPLADLLEPTEGAHVAELPAQVPSTVKARSRGVASFTTSEAISILDDPETVYPVVIDPSVTGSQTYAVRVTQDFNKYNSDIGSEGKIGYNGWTSPYYKSRMYYQFKLPVYDNVPVTAERLVRAEFSYVQTHSPQHSCTNTTFGPAVKVQFHNAIDSKTTWANQPDVHPGIGSVSNDYAVGHEDVCKKTYTQKWNVLSMLTAERYKYPTKTAVTVGIRSSDESDKNGWREYKHASGSSPKLTVEYEALPPSPSGLTASSLIPGAGMVTKDSGLELSTTVTLTKPSCPDSLQQGCVAARFTVTNTATGTISFAKDSTATEPGKIAKASLPEGTLATDQTTYEIAVETINKATGSISAPVRYSLSTDFPPGETTIAWAAEPRAHTPLAIIATNDDPLASFGWRLSYADEGGVQQTVQGMWKRDKDAPSTSATVSVGLPEGHFGTVAVSVWAIDSRGSTGPTTDPISAELLR